MKSRNAKLFSPQAIYKGVYTNLTIVVDTLKFIPAGIFSKLSLLIDYPVLLFISIVVILMFLVADFLEKVFYADVIQEIRVNYCDYDGMRAEIF